MAKASTIKKVSKARRSKSVGTHRAIKILTGELEPRTAVTTLIVGKKDAKVGKRAGGGPVIEKRVYGPDKSLRTVFTVDAGSATFESDLGYAFKKSVERARRENKKKTGHADAILPRR